MSRRINSEIEIKPTLLAKATYDFIIDKCRPPEFTRCEFMLLLVIARQTIGRRDRDNPDSPKEKDWLSMKQLKERTGYARTSLSKAQETLSKEGLIYITIADEHFVRESKVTLDSPKLRKLYGAKYQEKARFQYGLTPRFLNIVKRVLESSLSKS